MTVFALIVPYVAMAGLLFGCAWRLTTWTRAPVPFRIPTTGGQQRSLTGVSPSRLDNPSTFLGTLARMSLEVLLFRSLFRNTRAQLGQGGRLLQHEAKWLWLGAMLFHWSMLVVVIRHLRLAMEPVPAWVAGLAKADGFFEVGTPAVYLTDVVLVVALFYLLGRRLLSPLLRYLSQPADYGALIGLLGVVATGLWMRYVAPVDVPAVKQLVLGLVTCAPAVPDRLSAMPVLHLSLACAVVGLLPFTKLAHMLGVFLSPTRNLPNDTRARRHVNPWNPPPSVHGHAEWATEFREQIAKAGLTEERD